MTESTGGTSLLETPPYIIALVFLLVLLITQGFEVILEKIRKQMEKRNKKGLLVRKVLFCWVKDCFLSPLASSRARNAKIAKQLHLCAEALRGRRPFPACGCCSYAYNGTSS